jgi:hypothetical protein
MENRSNIYNIKDYSPLIEIIDSQRGYCLLKNLCPYSDRWYSVGITLEDGSPHIAMENPDECWIKHDQADEVMRNVLKDFSYNKASQDFFNSIQEQ